jgi:phytoene desaturase
MSTNPHRITVIGAGIGGLAAAARLAHQGFQVDVYERAEGPGGRCGRLEVNGFQFDTGPTLLLMPEVVEETFAAVGRKLSDYLELARCDPNYRIHFRDGSSVTFSTNLVDMQRELERIEKGSFRRYLEFLRVGQEQYQTSVEKFVGRNFDSVLDFLTPSNLRSVFRIKAHRMMYPEVARYFSDDRLRAALTFQTMYLGISPWKSPAVYGLLPYTELAVGIYFPKGGLYAVPQALERLGRELGVRFHYRAPVKRVIAAAGRATGVELADGRVIESDAVLCNADLPWAYEHLLQDTGAVLPKAEKLRYTSSAYMMYLGTTKRYPALDHHTVVFGGDYRGSFDDIFENFRVPEDPSFYVNAPAHSDPSMAPPGKDSIYILVPVPHRHPNVDWRVEGPKVRAKIFRRLAELGLEDLEQNLEVERTFTPDDYLQELNLAKGSAFGLSHDFFQVGPFRPANQDPNVAGLFFVGASTQPGTGVPMVLLSARLVAERVNDWAARTEPKRLLAHEGSRAVEVAA